MTIAKKTKWLLLVAVVAPALMMVTGCSSLKVINAVTSSKTYDKQADIAFGTDPRQKLDVYTPRDLKGQAPVVVFFYGGNWNSGNRADYKFVAEALASRGMVAVIADYRIFPQVRYPAFLDDSAAAVAWTVRNIARYRGDPQRVFVMGHSAGAYNAAMVALDKRWLAKYDLKPGVLRGWIGLAGPYNFLPIQNPEIRPIFFDAASNEATPDTQPINHVTAGAPPALLLASRHDETVDPYRNSGELASALRKAGVGVQERYFSNTNHVTLVATMSWLLRYLAPALDDVEQFVESDGNRVAPL